MLQQLYSSGAKKVVLKKGRAVAKSTHLWSNVKKSRSVKLYEADQLSMCLAMGIDSRFVVCAYRGIYRLKMFDGRYMIGSHPHGEYREFDKDDFTRELQRLGITKSDGSLVS